ncbi:MAG: sulfurtransferase TusA family protein [Nocardioides sp.]
MTPDVELDCRGLICPQPVIELGRAIAKIAIGQVIGVTATDPATRYDVPAWCRMKHQEFLGEQDSEDGVPMFLVRRVS